MGVEMMKYVCVECRFVSYKLDPKDGQTCTCGGLLEPLGWEETLNLGKPLVMTASVDVRNLEQVAEALTVMMDILADERIPEEIRKGYADRCSAIEWQEDTEQAGAT